ncbi:polysaccharide biosynthesis C-terminal domain-containing protein [Anaerorhabdus furcosa]|uniref:Membrane protein involved in the export of O-antigen and teichoic acid n=1 Tax=Anaerorhabdus furcosa TaxID=118967 RepID=A0A1T4K1K0_9FIRM|nr:polysaccharide biosynthesis C-terminal domain-containing protein [Anaerorhabdus furcosa]SJZ36268.1 Membrane protein involved in the export of O-antigen and teichoic acid [Anaerorhabdus furcosa]
MERKIVKNYIYSVIYQMLIVIMPLIVTPYTTRVIGINALTINTNTTNLVQWFVLFGIMGINIYGNREIARVRDDSTKLSKTFFEIFAMQVFSMLIASLAFFFYIYIIGDQYQTILLIQSISLLSVAFDITWFFYGVEDFKSASIRNMIVKIIGVVLIFMLVKGPNDLFIFVLINTCTGVLGQIIMWLQLKQYIHFVPISLKGIIQHIKPNIALFIPQIAISVYSILDITMLKILGPVYVETNLYEQTQKFVKMFLFFITSIGTVMLPRVSNVHSKGDRVAVNNYLNKTLRLALYLSIPMIFGISAMIQNFVDWFLPESYQIVGLLIQCTSPIILFISLSNVFGTQFLVPTGNTKPYTLSVVVGAIVNFLINWTLIPTYGVFGAIIGSVVAELSVTLVQYFYIKNRIDFDFKVKELFIVCIASLIMFIPTHYIGVFLGANFFVNLLQISVGILTYFLILFLFRAPLLKELPLNLFKRK